MQIFLRSGNNFSHLAKNTCKRNKGHKEAREKQFDKRKMSSTSETLIDFDPIFRIKL